MGALACISQHVQIVLAGQAGLANQMAQQPSTWDQHFKNDHYYYYYYYYSYY